MIENYEPTVQDVIDLKAHVINRRKELNIGFLNTSSTLIALMPQKI